MAYLIYIYVHLTRYETKSVISNRGHSRHWINAPPIVSQLYRLGKRSLASLVMQTSDHLTVKLAISRTHGSEPNRSDIRYYCYLRLTSGSVYSMLRRLFPYFSLARSVNSMSRCAEPRHCLDCHDLYLFDATYNANFTYPTSIILTNVFFEIERVVRDFPFVSSLFVEIDASATSVFS